VDLNFAAADSGFLNPTPVDPPFGTELKFSQ